MNQTKGLNSNALKLIAIIAMTIDHVTWTVFPGYQKELPILLLHTIGRLTMPIMCFFIAEGYHYTHNLSKYLIRLFTFSVISHFAYNFAFGIPFIPFQTTVFNQTSIMWSLAWGLAALMVRESKNPKLTQGRKTAIIIAISIVTFCSDWSSIAVLVVIGDGLYRGNFKKQMSEMLIYVAFYAAVYFLFVDRVYGLLQMAVALSIPLLKQYNGQRGKLKGMKWFFYIYYPLHLVLCGILRIMLNGNVGVMIGA